MFRVMTRIYRGEGRGAVPAKWWLAVQSECTFNGAWGGSKAPAVFYISSYFWDRATDVGLIPDDKSISVIISPSDFRSAALQPCTARGIRKASLFPLALPTPLDVGSGRW